MCMCIGTLFLNLSFAGKSRSVAFVLAYIMKKERVSFEEALKKMREIYPLAEPNQYFGETLRKIEGQLMGQSSYESEDLLDHGGNEETCEKKIEEEEKK